jgi:hypothetical protein
MHTKDMLAAALREVGLETMAAKAEKGFYHDFMSPLATPALQLLYDLGEQAVGSRDQNRCKVIMALRKRVMDGEFDASEEESDAWASSEEAQRIFDELVSSGGQPRTVKPDQS